MGCLKSVFYQIGCFVLIVATAALAFVYREQVKAVYHRMRGITPPPDAVYVLPAPQGPAEATRALESLGRRNGPAFVDLTAGQVASLIDASLGRTGGRVIDSVTVGLLEGEIRVRGSLDLSGVPRDMLGPLKGAVGAREPVVIGGPLRADSAGRVLLQVTTLRLRDFPFPRSTVPRILEAARVPGAAGATVPVPGTGPVGDVRVSATAVRVYRRTPR